MQKFSEHLEAAADADQLAAITQVAADGLFMALLAQPVQVGLHRLGAGQHEQVAGRNALPGTDPVEVDLRMQTQGVEVVVVGAARIDHGDGLESGGCLADDFGGDCILGIEHQSVQIGNHAQHRFAGALLQPVEPAFEQADVAAKAVDDKALDARLLRRREQLQCSHQVREDAAAVDVGNQNHRHVGGFGEAHVGDVAIAQIDFRRTAGAFHQHTVEFGLEPLPAFHHRLHRNALVLVIVAGIQGVEGFAVDDHLRALLGGGFQQHRVEIDARREPRRQRLQRLGAADFAAVGGDGRVQGHVLWLERRDVHTASPEDAAQRGDQRRFAGIRGAALHHQGAGSTGSAHR